MTFFTVRNEVAKVMFLQACVCPQGGEVCLVPGGLLRGGSAPGGVCSGGVVSQHALRQTPPPGETATAADGTHPTGMHSCLCYFRAYCLIRLSRFQEEQVVFNKI